MVTVWKITREENAVVLIKMYAQYCTDRLKAGSCMIAFKNVAKNLMNGPYTSES